MAQPGNEADESGPRQTLQSSQERTSARSGELRVPDGAHQRPSAADDDTVEAMGKVGEAWEWVERLRGRLYDFHQMIGRADLLFGDAADALEAAGHPDEANQLRETVVGRNVLDGRWSFQIVEEFDACYYRPTAEVERTIRDRLMEGKIHVYEAEMKERRRTYGDPAHSSRPHSEGP